MLLKDIDSKQLKTSIVCCKDLINKIENDDVGIKHNFTISEIEQMKKNAEKSIKEFEEELNRRGVSN